MCNLPIKDAKTVKYMTFVRLLYVYIASNIIAAETKITRLQLTA